jgi:hypothetical protein
MNYFGKLSRYSHEGQEASYRKPNDEGKVKHPHAELIKAWADGAEIEARFLDADGWTNWRLQEGGFIWYHSNAEYRIKPEPKPDIVFYFGVSLNLYSNGTYGVKSTIFSDSKCDSHNVKLIFDGETDELKSAEVIK